MRAFYHPKRLMVCSASTLVDGEIKPIFLGPNGFSPKSKWLRVRSRVQPCICLRCIFAFMVAYWRIDVICAVVMRNLWITYYFFVRQLILCGCICSGCLGSIGSCQVQSRTYYSVDFIGLGSIVLIFGIWSQPV